MKKIYKISLSYKYKIYAIGSDLFALGFLTFLCTAIYSLPYYRVIPLENQPAEIYIGYFSSLLLWSLGGIIKELRYYLPANLILNPKGILIQNKEKIVMDYAHIKDVVNLKPYLKTKTIRFTIVTTDNHKMEIKADRELYELLEELVSE